MVIRYVVFIFLCTFFEGAAAQPAACPDNLGFDTGTFNHWDCFTATRTGTAPPVYINSGPVQGRHTLIPPASRAVDKFGSFPVHSPGATGYSVKLGNESDGAETERISYTFSIPQGLVNYSIVYQYAMVAAFEAVETDAEKPSFVVTVFDETDNRLVDCVTHRLVSSDNFPGVKRSPTGINIYYIPWTNASIDLSGYAGKVLRVEFTTADCFYPIPGDGHFGYAYLDVTDNCGSLITGNQYCDAAVLTLQAPPGFKDYQWFNADLSRPQGNGNTLQIKPAPPVNTVYALKLTPLEGFGCPDTLFTAISYGLPVTDFILKDTLYICSNSGADLTAPALTQGSGPDISFTYFNDEEGKFPVDDPHNVTKAGIVYVKAMNSSGCTQLKAIHLVFYPANLVINDPQIAYAPFTVDLTDPRVTAGSSPGFTFSYWKDARTTVPLASPAALTTSGTYYIKAVKGDCTSVRSVRVTVKSVVPDIFTPNGDGYNDVFHIAGPEDKVNFRIFNRWGELVFSGIRSGNSWDGTANGKKQPAGTYYWIIESIDPSTGKRLVLKGPITLIR